MTLSPRCKVCWSPITDDQSDGFCNFGCRDKVAKPPKETKPMTAIPTQQVESNEKFNASDFVEQSANALINEATSVIINGTEAPAGHEFTNGDLLQVFMKAAEILKVRARNEIDKRQAELDALKAACGVSTSAKAPRGGGKRHRSSKEDMATAMTRIVETLAASTSPMSATKIVETSGIDQTLFASSVRKLIADKKVDKNGKGRSMTYVASSAAAAELQRNQGRRDGSPALTRLLQCLRFSTKRNT